MTDSGTTTRETGSKTTAAMQTTAIHGSAHDPQQGCADCKKSGLAILPVVPMLLPNELRGLTDEFKKLDGHLKAEDLKTHWYAMRTLPAGYLYVLRPDKTWDGYIVDAEGLLRNMPPGEMPADPSVVTPMSDACKRNSDNIPAQVIAIDPAKHAAVWVAFSRYRWTAKVLKDYADNKDGRRDSRMTKIDIMAAANGSLGAEHKAANAVRFGVPMTAEVGKYVVDYASNAACDFIDKRVVVPVRRRAAQGRALAARMAEISKNTAGKTGAIILLQDQLGVTMELNALRNAETAWLGAYVAENQRKIFVGNVIKGFEKAFTANGQGAVWNERFRAPCYNYTQIDADQDNYKKKVDPWEEKINVIANDVATLNGSATLKAWWRDFDPDDDQSAKDRQKATAACLVGAVKTKKEQALWERWFEEDPSDPHSMLWGAVTALDVKFGAFLVGKMLPPDTTDTQFDKLADMAKNFVDAKEYFDKWMKNRSSTDAIGMIGLAMTSQITRLKIVNPALYRVAGMRVLIIAAARTTVTMSPVSVTVTQTQVALMMAEAAFGPPQASMRRLLDIEAASPGKRVFVVGSNGIVFEELSQTAQKTRVVELWLPEEIAAQVRQARLPAGAVLKALPRPVNYFQGLMTYTKTLPGAFVWAGMLMQAINLTNNGTSFYETKNNTADTYFDLASGALGVMGATLEIGSGTMGKMVDKKMAIRFVGPRVAQVALVGGTLAGFSAIAESIQLGIKAGQRYDADDADAGRWYAVSSVLIGLSGVFAIGGALAIASSQGALVGGFSFLASTGAAALAFIPVWGWIALGAIVLVAGLIMLWKAIQDTDTPMEEWLKHCIYGKYPKYTPKEEMEKLNDVAYAMTIETDWEDAPVVLPLLLGEKVGYDIMRFDISLPGLSATSMIDCKIFLKGKGGRKEIFKETILRTRMVNGVPHDPHQTPSRPDDGPYVNGRPSFSWLISPHIYETRYTGTLQLDDDVYSSAEIEFQYWPNSETMPSFVLPKQVDSKIPIIKIED
jgi:hypothetical protein